MSWHRFHLTQNSDAMQSPPPLSKERCFLCHRKCGVTVQTLLSITLMISDLGQSNSRTASLFEAIPIWVYLHQYMPSREYFKPLKATRFEILPKLYICSKRPRGTFASVIASSGSSSIHQGILQTSKYAQWVQATFQFLQGCFTVMGIPSLFYSHKHSSRNYLGGQSQKTASKGYS